MASPENINYFPIASRSESRKHSTHMKPLHFLLIALSAALSSCGSMHDPIYYDNADVKETKVAEQAGEIPPTNINNNSPSPASARPAVADAQPVNKKQPTPRRTSPFMQPDVFGMPKTEDLKETATSTQNNSGSSGLTVPNQ